MQEQELFQSYEVKNWDFSPRIYKILAFSAIFNVLALLIVAQSNLLTKKGCDSPLVGQVCQVLDTVYVGTKILSTDSSTGDVPYDPTQLSPDDEIVWVNVADKLYYPEGYFALSNPELMQPQNIDPTMMPSGFDNAQVIPGITPPAANSPNPALGGGVTNVPGGGLLNKPQKLPKVNKNPVNGKLPSPNDILGDVDDNATKNPIGPKKTRPDKNKPNTDLTAVNGNGQNTTPQATPSPSPTPNPDDVATEDQYGVYRNKKPLKDYAQKALVEVKKVKLDAPFSVTITADLDTGKDGKTIVLKNAKPVKNPNQPAGDKKMEKLVQDAILAVGDSGWLGYLKTVAKVNKVTFTLTQDDNFVTARIVGDQQDENIAKTNASGLGGIISIAKGATDGDEKVLLEGATTTAEGKTLVLNVAIPKPVAQEMITRKLKEAEEKAAQKPSSTAQMADVNAKNG
ncbi:MAG: hypothetical protein JSS81_14315 [Acidobacteria bacterium]|nr:hypothetical protein [Acidobacteriota bacterium]